MHYVYILQATDAPNRFYTGITEDSRAKLRGHSAGRVPYTSKYKLGPIKTYTAFSDEQQVFAFEKYLKSASGRALAKKRV